jgi:hypothetical protein
MPTHRGAWLRYGDPLKDDEVRFAMDHYGVAVLQPWETDPRRHGGAVLQVSVVVS